MTLTSRERLILTLNHEEPDRVPLDLGATAQTGINASTLYQLRKALGLQSKPITVHEPAQILGVVDRDVMQALGVDVIGLWNPVNTVGVRNTDWKPWTMPDGTPTMMAGGMRLSVDDSGNTYLYPQGDASVSPSMKMPAEGYSFDNIDRGGDYDEDALNARRDFSEDFTVFDDDTARYLESESERLYETTSYGIVGNWAGGGFGDVFTLPAPWLTKVPHGIRKMEDWLTAHVLYQDYIRELFDMQSEIALKNLEIYRQAVGERIQVIWVSGTDFGTQNGPFFSPEIYRKLYKPFHKKLNDWIHKNTNWKIFYHSCGSVVSLLDDFVEAGVDILNPVQCSSAGMDPVMLKQKYGKTLVFWGGGVDTQRVLPFGTPEEVRAEVNQRLRIFAPGGGFVFNTIHNIVGGVPAENLTAMYDAVRENNA
ncbi:Uroporphyrinogen decarboxylase [Acididesulfobacillus acetoxydans]|uniref:Methyltransferase CmuC n=1 Tax=Acididesulfobacillus acetoxydans TaxID=1561005 RepID=A0A8S0VWZ1_9FIRM|nr:uroporphyrinogen decarboxylase family protein [Acididesulfobacillus acetoxydans]CAA7601393.1 Uroporphyrinogen decarboxylase [Acididesulfobacillus acetoxydans]CEJ08824.1 Methyltransferase CmuC [Acididesulfobacillus acetoxydans]